MSFIFNTFWLHLQLCASPDKSNGKLWGLYFYIAHYP